MDSQSQQMNIPMAESILGLTGDYSLDDLKHAYKKMSQTHHPDVDGGSNEFMVSINAARDYLLEHFGEICNSRIKRAQERERANAQERERERQTKEQARREADAAARFDEELQRIFAKIHEAEAARQEESKKESEHFQKAVEDDRKKSREKEWAKLRVLPERKKKFGKVTTLLVLLCLVAAAIPAFATAFSLYGFTADALVRALGFTLVSLQNFVVIFPLFSFFVSSVLGKIFIPRWDKAVLRTIFIILLTIFQIVAVLGSLLFSSAYVNMLTGC